MTTVTRLQTTHPAPAEKNSHHVGSPPSAFVNPWPSFNEGANGGLLSLFKVKFGSQRPAFIPVPDRSELVQTKKPTWGHGKSGLKATWIGHASFLVETTSAPHASRGVRILCDPVFSERTSPVSFLGPKRYTPTPCTLEEVPEVDLVLISHSHYDHCDIHTIRHLHRTRGKSIHFFAGLRNATWYHSLGIPPDQVHELDWWDSVLVGVDGVGSVRLTCTPTQHFSGRTPNDRNKTLWCSYVIEEQPVVNNSTSTSTASSPTQHQRDSQLIYSSTPPPKKLFFAGDTGYRSVPSSPNSPTTPSIPPSQEFSLAHNPSFHLIGQRFGPFDLCLLPIGLCNPRPIMSPIHCNPSDSLCIHRDLRSKKSVGMHWGTVRGGLSQEYEDVRWPPREWERVVREAGMRWRRQGRVGVRDFEGRDGQEGDDDDDDGDWDAGLMQVGETLVV